MSDPAPAVHRPHRRIGFAHRGGKAHAPENTLRAFSNALSMGVNGLESDVWITADGVPVLDHDGVVRPRGWPFRRPVPLTTLERDALPAHLPSLADLYHRCGTGFELSLDVKDPDAAVPTMAVAADAGALDRLWLCTPSRRRLKEWRAAGREVRLVDSAPLAAFRADPQARIHALAAIGADALNLHHRAWSPALVDAVHATGRQAWAWDAQRTTVVRRLVAMGVDAVFSDHVDRLVAELGL